MKNYNDWALLVAKNLQGEADLIAAIDKDELDDNAARTAFIAAVLEPFLPQSYAIGSGRVVDAAGNYSDHLDIVIYHRDYPRIGVKSTHSVYLYESVLAAFAIRGKLLRKSLMDAMDSCASLAGLNPNINEKIYKALAEKKGMQLNQHGEYEHSDQMRTERFRLIARPPTFIFGFTGIKNSHKQLSESIEVWLQHRREASSSIELKALPAVIATQGCFAWRNSAPLALKANRLFGLGNDPAPVRLIILQLMHLLSRRLGHTVDSYGFKQSLEAYLQQMAPPVFEGSVGRLNETALQPQVNSQPETVTDEQPPANEPAATNEVEAAPMAQSSAEESQSAVIEDPTPTAAQEVQQETQQSAPEASHAFDNASFNKPRKPLVPPAEPVAEPATQVEPEKPEMKTLDSAIPSMSAEPAAETPQPAMKTLDSGVPSMSAAPQAGTSDGPQPGSEDHVPEFIIDDSFAPEEDDEAAPVNSASSLSSELDFPKLEDPDANKDDEFEQTLVMKKSQQPAVEAAKAPEAPANAQPIEQPAQISQSSADSNNDEAEEEFEQTLVMQAPLVQEQPGSNDQCNTSKEINSRVDHQAAAPEPFPHLAPTKKEEVEAFTSTIPQ